MSVSHALRPDTDHGGSDVICALLSLFGSLADPRSPRGIRHELASVLTITVLSVLAEARNFREAGDRAAELPACRCWRDAPGGSSSVALIDVHCSVDVVDGGVE